MRQSCKIVATVLKEISQIVKPGITTADLDAYDEKRIREMGAIPSFKGYHGFPGSICACINNEVVHGIPNKKKVIRVGDVLKVDTGAYYEEFGILQSRDHPWIAPPSPYCCFLICSKRSNLFLSSLPSPCSVLPSF